MAVLFPSPRSYKYLAACLLIISPPPSLYSLAPPPPVLPSPPPLPSRSVSPPSFPTIPSPAPPRPAPQIVKGEGVAGLYKGLVPRLGRVIPGQGIIFMSYERIQTVVAGMIEGPTK